MPGGDHYHREEEICLRRWTSVHVTRKGRRACNRSSSRVHLDRILVFLQCLTDRDLARERSLLRGRAKWLGGEHC